MNIIEEPMSTKQSIEKLDPNFQAAVVEDGLQWHDARDFLVEGQGWPQESAEYSRLPDRAEKIVRQPVWELSRHSSGLRVRFVSNTPKLAARWKLRFETLGMPHMPANGVSGLDLYARDDGRWRWAGFAGVAQYPDNEAVLFDEEKGDEREYTLYLPLYNGVSELQIGALPGAEIRAVENEAKKPICIYGTSITQGGCASRAGLAYPAILGRILEWPTINLGFSGNGQAEPEVAQLLAELDPAIFVLDCLPNLQPEQVLERVGPFVETLRAARSSTPIALMEHPIYQDTWLKADRHKQVWGDNEALQTVRQKLREAGVTGLHYVAGETLYADDGNSTVDGGHANDIGFLHMAQALAPVLEQLL